MVINTGRRGKYDPSVELPRAIHLEVAEGQAARVSTRLQEDYSSRNLEFPMGIKMRFVPDINQLMNFTTRTKSIQLSTRQMAFEEKMCYPISWEVADLCSVQSIEGNRSLAELITSIPSKKYPHLNIFHSVTPGYQTGTTPFAFIPQLEPEARTMMAALLPYLRAHYGDSIFKYFTTVAGDRVMSCSWDPETNQVISPSDQAVDDAATMDEEYHFTSTQGQVVVEMPTVPAAPVGDTAAFAQETDSVSTFRKNSKRSAKNKLPKEPPAPKTAPKKQAPKRASQNQDRSVSDDRSQGSTASALTMETLETAVQSVVQQLFDDQLESIIQRAITQSMQQMHGLAVSANTQRESKVEQIQAQPSDKSHKHTADDDNHSGGPSGASAKG